MSSCCSGERDGGREWPEEINKCKETNYSSSIYRLPLTLSFSLSCLHIHRSPSHQRRAHVATTHDHCLCDQRGSTHTQPHVHTHTHAIIVIRIGLINFLFIKGIVLAKLKLHSFFSTHHSVDGGSGDNF